MKLTVDQLLMKGVASHKEGKLQEAEHLYRVILQSQPTHPDANHNLGILAVSLKKPRVALPLFKVALDINPSIEQFWISYIDALIKEKQFGNADRIIKQAKKMGFVGEKLNALAAQLIGINYTEPGVISVPLQAPSQMEIDSLLASFQSGDHQMALDLALSIAKKFPEHSLSWKVSGAIFQQTGQVNEALIANQKAVTLDPKDANSHSNLGITLRNLGKLEQAEASYRQSITLKPDFTEAHYNLGNVLKQLGRLEQAEVCYRQALALKPDFAEAHYSVGITLNDLGRLEQAEASYRQAIALKPGYAEAHGNLGNTLKKLGRLEQAEASYKQALALNPGYAEGHYNLGVTLNNLGRLEQAEASYRQALALNPGYAEAHSNLGNTLKNKGDLVSALDCAKKSIEINPQLSDSHFNMAVILYASGHFDSALASIEKADHIDPKSKDNKLLLAILRGRKGGEETKISPDNINNSDCGIRLNSNPLILRRDVEVELIANLYDMNFKGLDKTADARYGNGRCSPDFNLFEDDRSIIKTLEEDLMRIMMHAVKSDVYVFDSFFNILGTGGGTTPHCHLTSLDKENGLDLGNQKYSLVYYLSVGDQNCSEPGILKLYGPSQDILPSDGMIVIMPAGRMHSAVYGGKKDRVMIGVNFYSL